LHYAVSHLRGTHWTNRRISGDTTSAMKEQ